MALLALLAQGLPSDEVATKPAETLPVAWRNIAYETRTTASQVRIRPGDKENTRSFHIMREVKEVRFLFQNAMGNGPIAGNYNPVTYSGSAAGRPITFGGELSAVCQPGEVITSDPLPLELSAGAELSVTVKATGEQVQPGSRDLRPWQIQGKTDQPSVLVIGSSSGVPDEFTYGLLDAGLPVANASIGGTHARTFDESELDVLGVTPEAGFTHALLQVGINSNGSLPNTMAQGAVDLAWRLRSRGISHITQKVYKPHTASVDGWATLEGQTPRHAGRARAAAWLRRGAPVTADGKKFDEYGTSPGAITVGQAGHPFDEVLDLSRAVSAWNGAGDEVFRVDAGPISSDGLHINQTGYEMLRPVIAQWGARIAAAYAHSSQRGMSS